MIARINFSNTVFVACLLLYFPTAYSQIISVEDYLQNPSLVRMRLVASTSPNILSTLMERYNAADSRRDKVNCLRAINACVVQTAESKRFIRSIAADRSSHRSVVEHAKLGVWLNDENRKVNELNKKDFLYWDQVSKIGPRLEYLVDETESDSGSLEIYFLFNDRSRAFSSAIGEQFDRTLRKRVDFWLSKKADEAVAVSEELSRVLDEFRHEGVDRKILAWALRSQTKVVHLGDSSIRSKLVLACLDRLDSKSISQQDFGWLKAMANPKLVDTESSALLYYMVAVERLLLRQKHSPNDFLADGEETVEFFAEHLFLDLAPQYLNAPIESARASETRMIARRCFELIAKTNSDDIRRRCATVVDRLMTSSDQKEIMVGLELAGIVPTEVQQKAIAQFVYQKDRATIPLIRAKAALVLLSGQGTIADSKLETAGSREFYESYVHLKYDEKFDLAVEFGTFDPDRSFELLFELLATQTNKDDERVTELCRALLFLFSRDNRYRLDPEIIFAQIPKRQVAIAGPMIFHLTGPEGVGLSRFRIESLIENLIDHNQYGRKALYSFISDNTESAAAKRCTEFLLKRTYDRLRSNVSDLQRLNRLNPDPDAFSYFVANFGPVLEGAIRAAMVEVEPDLRKLSMQDLLKGHIVILQELKKISSNKDHPLNQFAVQQLQEIHELTSQD